MFTVLIGYRSDSGNKHTVSTWTFDNPQEAADEVASVLRIGCGIDSTLFIKPEQILYVTIDRSKDDE